MSILSDILSGLGKQSYESRIEARIYNVVLNSLIYCRHSGMDEYFTAQVIAEDVMREIKDNIKKSKNGLSIRVWHGAGAPSPPSEEGGGCLHKGFEQADGGRDTPSMCEST